MITVLQATDYTFKKENGDYVQVQKHSVPLCKRFLANGEILPPAIPQKYKLESKHDISNVFEMHSLLVSLEKDPYSCIIRYDYLPKHRLGDIVVRRSEELVLNGTGKVIAIDCDDLELPPRIESWDIKAQAEYVLSLLNTASDELFPKGLGYVAQASSSAGLSKKIKLHLWLINEFPITNLQIKQAMYIANTALKQKVADLALYSTGQIHYTSAPVFENPKLQDPFFGKCRIVVSKGKTCRIPEQYSEFIAPVRVTKVETNEYLSRLSGSHTPNQKVCDLIDLIQNWNPRKSGLRTKVIALYHNALQSQFDLTLLDSLIGKSLEKARPGLSGQYILEAKNAAFGYLKSCSVRSLEDSCFSLKVINESSKSKDHTRHLRLGPFPFGAAVFLKASLGSGKTHTIQKMLETGKITGTFLAITDTSSLVESNAKRFGAGDLRNIHDRGEFFSDQIDRLSTTIHSLHRLRECDRRFDFVFIDEADSVLNTLLFASIIKDTIRIEIIDTLKHILQTCGTVVFSDGDLSQETMEGYCDLMECCKPIHKIEHFYPVLKGLKAHRHKSVESLYGALAACVEIGSKSLVVTDNSPDNLNILANTLKRLYPRRNIAVVHADSKADDETIDIINRTTEALEERQIDVLLCSPSVTSGVDFNYFETTFLVTNANIHSPNLRFQALMRERNPDEIHYFTDSRIKGFDTGYSNFIGDGGWAHSTMRKLATRREKEFKVYGASINYYLLAAGAKVRFVNESYKCPITEEDELFYLEEKTFAILNAADGKLTPRFNNAHHLLKTIELLGEVNYETVRAYLDNPVHVKFDFFTKVALQFWDVIKTRDNKEINKAIKEKGHLLFLLTGCSVKDTPASVLLKKCGIDDTTNLEEYIDLYIRYCTTHSIIIPQNIKRVAEDIAEL